MSIFTPKFQPTDKPINHHPWANRIKDEFSNKIKYAHNSIRNPIYPKKKEDKDQDAKKMKFTVIGDRVTKEFTFCTNLVKGLYKYRKKIFEPPEIRGVTTIEWPSVLHDLQLRLGGLTYCINSSVAVLLDNEFLGSEKELKDFVKTKYTYHLSLDYCKEGIAEFAKFVNSSGRPCAYLNLMIESENIGTLIFMLYSDIVPNTCENFLRLCKEKRGGYPGTTIHRVVKDGWIQGGGYALKSTELSCENFLVPHDRRGVLCMANDGRHIDCSTQFFVLLQPAPWMRGRYVAFGQLIEGKGTLEKIESVPTWYESPKTPIVIYEAGVLNMDCQHININKGTNEYIDGHIEDLNALGDQIMKVLLENVFLTAELREIERLKEESEGVDFDDEEDTVGSVREAQRFIRKKEDIEMQIQSTKLDTVPRSTLPSIHQRSHTASYENNDFDVETYDDEYEQPDYAHQSLHTPSVVVKPVMPFYLPLTDQPYPGEKDSNFNLRRFLQGDYCLECDLDMKVKKPLGRNQRRTSDQSVMFDIDETDSDTSDEDDDLNSEDEKEIHKYLKLHSDRVSFAGDIVKKMAKSLKLDFKSKAHRCEQLTDEQLRKIRLAELDQRAREHHNKKVSISLNLPVDGEHHHSKIKRRQTGFVRAEDLEKIRVFQTVYPDPDKIDDDNEADVAGGDEVNVDDEVGGNRKVRIADTVVAGHGIASGRRATGYVRSYDVDDDDYYDDSDDDDESGTPVRQSVLVRLFDDVRGDDEPPTLKDYKPQSETHQKNILLKFSSNYRIKSDENARERYVRHSSIVDHSYDEVLNLQHGKRIARKISSDYVKTIDQMEHRLENSIRSVEFAKTRPAMSVAEYQMKNKMYQTSKLSDLTKPETDLDDSVLAMGRKDPVSIMLKKGNVTIMQPYINQQKQDPGQNRGLRLPGDSPIYSATYNDIDTETDPATQKTEP